MLQSLRDCAFACAYRASEPSRRARNHYLLAEAVHVSHDPIRIWVDPALASDADRLVRVLLDALELIGETDDRWFRRVTRDYPWFLIRDAPEANYWPYPRVIVLPASLLEKAPTEVALSLIDQMTLARLTCGGIPWLPSRVVRLKRNAIRQQIRFLRRLEQAGWKVHARISWCEAEIQRPLIVSFPFGIVIRWLVTALPLWLLFALLYRAEREHHRLQRGTSP